MHVLWSRAAQARSSCSCRSCLHTATNLARRTTSAVTKRRFKVSDVFTACYSTILATAAVVDMRRKEERRGEWDRLIAEARAGTMNTREYTDLESSESCTTIPTVSKLRHRQPDLHYKPMAVGNSTAGKDSSFEVKLRQLGSQLGGDSEYVEEQPDLQLFAREPNVPLHLSKMEGMVARLVDQFLIKSKIFSIQHSQGAQFHESQAAMEQMRGQLQSLMGGSTNLPTFEWNDVDDVYEQRDALHWSLYTVCRNTAPDDQFGIRLMLAKISYNLLISRASPSISTYNILLAEFIRLKQVPLAQLVVDSYMHDSKFKPNQLTLKLTLDHYRIKGDSNGFRSITQRMRASRGTTQDLRPDMLVRKRSIRSLVAPGVQEWAFRTKTIHRYGALHQKTPRDATVFNSQILGNLQFKGVKAAIRVVQNAFREGHRVHHDTLSLVIQACIDQLDFSAGIKLIRNMLSLWADGVGYIITEYTETLRQLLYHLLVMCGFDTSLNSRQDLPIKSSREAYQELLTFMHLQSINEAVDRLSQVTWSMYETIYSSETSEATTSSSQDRFGLPQQQGIDQALYTLKEFSVDEESRRLRQKELVAASRWTRLKTLETLLDLRWTHVTAVETELTTLIYHEPYFHKYALSLRLVNADRDSSFEHGIMPRVDESSIVSTVPDEKPHTRRAKEASFGSRLANSSTFTPPVSPVPLLMSIKQHAELQAAAGS